jgi:hypothetical protein
MESERRPPLVLPSADRFPPAGATPEEIIRFACAVDPTLHFRGRWGEHYKANIEALWRRCVESYRASDLAAGPMDELLMCLAYDVILGPSLGVPDPHKLPFLRWLIEGARREVT